MHTQIRHPTVMEWSSADIQRAKVYHPACRILEDIGSQSSLTMAQATAYLLIKEDYEEMAGRRRKFIAEAIACLDAHAVDGQDPTSSYNSLTSANKIYHSNVATRTTRERRGIHRGICQIVRMVNEFGILMVSEARGNPIRVAP